MSASPDVGAEPLPDVTALQQRLREVEDVNVHLREQLFAVHAQRVRMQGYLFRFKPDAVSLFNDAWERRYFSLVDACLKCFHSEKTMALIPETEILVQGYVLHWEGKKRKKFWAFGLKDAAGCVVVRLSSTDRATAVKWMSALEESGAGRHAPKLLRMQSMPHEQSTDRQEVQRPAMELPDVVEASKQRKVRRTMCASTPVHTQGNVSILSSERLFQHPHPGLLNLGTVILFAANFRLVLENVFKYGLRVNPFLWFERLLWGSSQPLMLCWPVLGLSAYLALLIENLAARFLKEHESLQKKSESTSPVLKGEAVVISLHVSNVVFCFLMPLWLVYLSVDAVLPSFVLTFVTLIVCMKLISYAHCNADLRSARVRNEDRDTGISYPNNISRTDLMYFLFAPTLTYQTFYPRTQYVRGKWILKRCGELALLLALQLAIIDQYIVPAVENSMQPMQNRDFIALVERILKLSLPVLYAWLIMFYIFFHLWLNILAEAMRFGDREFYLDWWNALNLGDYWKMWNTPVHKWMLRTIYYPAIHTGLSNSLKFGVTAV